MGQVELPVDPLTFSAIRIAPGCALSKRYVVMAQVGEEPWLQLTGLLCLEDAESVAAGYRRWLTAVLAQDRQLRS